MSSKSQNTSKAKRHTEVIVDELPKCGFCPKTAEFDSQTVFGPWAYMCPVHFALYGVGLGTGKGQKLVLEKPKGPKKRTRKSRGGGHVE